jgi:hypothetical protein
MQHARHWQHPEAWWRGKPGGTRTEADRYVLPAEIRDAFARSLSTTVPDGMGPQLRKAPSQQR